MTIIFGKNELMTENMLPDGGKIKSIFILILRN